MSRFRLISERSQDRSIRKVDRVFARPVLVISAFKTGILSAAAYCLPWS